MLLANLLPASAPLSLLLWPYLKISPFFSVTSHDWSPQICQHVSVVSAYAVHGKGTRSHASSFSPSNRTPRVASQTLKRLYPTSSVNQVLVCVKQWYWVSQPEMNGDLGGLAITRCKVQGIDSLPQLCTCRSDQFTAFQAIQFRMKLFGFFFGCHSACCLWGSQLANLWDRHSWTTCNKCYFSNSTSQPSTSFSWVLGWRHCTTLNCNQYAGPPLGPTLLRAENVRLPVGIAPCPPNRLQCWNNFSCQNLGHDRTHASWYLLG